MATPEAISALRLKIGEPENTDPYTDAALSDRLDANNGDANKTAYEIWTEKAAATANLVDITEGGSTRKQGDLYEQALSMAKFYKGQIEEGEPVVNGPGVRIKKLVRS